MQFIATEALVNKCACSVRVQLRRFVEIDEGMTVPRERGERIFLGICECKNTAFYNIPLNFKR